MKTAPLFFLIFVCTTLHAQRTITNINSGWSFRKETDPKNKNIRINLPHTWNVSDVMDDSPGYYRGVGWYKRNLQITNPMLNNHLSLYFEGANQETEVFVNGKKAGHHIGGYTAFAVSIDSYVKPGSNEVVVKVDNKHDVNIPPLTADFTFYGGVYRDVFLIETSDLHFADDAGNTGVFISTPKVSKEIASVTIKSLVKNESTKPRTLFILNIINDKAGYKITSVRSSVILQPGAVDSVVQELPSVKNPKLWSPENPYLYSVQSIITDEKGNLIDRVINPLGFRWFSFDAEKGFFLNGQTLKLVGASRHQDHPGLGNAVADALAIKDVLLLKKMGGNFLRVAHYPQDPAVLKACDSLGLLASVEIPVVNEITESDSFYNNCEQMQLEMVKQNFNHPSVIMWCYMNEVLLRPHFNNDKEKQKVYFNNIKLLAQRLEDITRKADPSRYTMMANHGSFNQYKNVGLLEIPMIVGWNLYSGWYGGKLTDFPVFLDDFHKAYPNKPVIVSEYGSDADLRIRSDQPVRFDKSIEYTTAFHQYYLTEMQKRPFVAGAAVWNLADFNSETRNETMPHINNKGLLKWDRTPKDPYFYYQAMLSKKPYVKILGDKIRNGVSDSSSAISLQNIQIASNLEQVNISLNGNKQTVAVKNGLASVRFPFKNGVNLINVEGIKNGKIHRDQLQTTVRMQPFFFTYKSFQDANIILGTTRYFRDDKGNWWQPDQAYQKNRFGSVGGKPFKIESNTRLPYGTDKNILDTDNDPIYQTQQVGIQRYRFDVLPGTYELVLHFAELLGGEISSLPYNLSDDKREEKIKRRVFDVSVNDKLFIKDLNIANQFGSAKAVVKKTIVAVKNNEGIVIDFHSKEGEPVLNAVQLKKIK